MIKKITILLLIPLLLIGCSKKADTYDSQGKPIYLSSYQGKWVLVNYWATWCKPCAEEMPILNKLSKRYADHVVVIGVSYDKLSNKKLQHVKHDLSLDYPLVATFPESKLNGKSVSVLPVTFVIDPSGKLTAVLTGPQTEAQLKQAISLK